MKRRRSGKSKSMPTYWFARSRIPRFLLFGVFSTLSYWMPSHPRQYMEEEWSKPNSAH